MSISNPPGYVNPRLGTYFGIFISAYVALAFLTLILEGLGFTPTYLRALMLIGPVLLYATIGNAAATSQPLDFFASGRRVPAFYTGLTLAQTALGATGLVTLTGTFFLIGFDALCLVIGGLAGFVFMAVLLAPFVRKFGAFTIPTYLGRRLDSLPVRLIAAAIVSVPMLLILAAELQIGALAASWLLNQHNTALVAIVAVLAGITILAGGMRSLAWVSSAQAIAALLAIIIPVTVVAVIINYLPLPQLSAGPILRSIARTEAAQGLPIILPPALAFDLPEQGLSQIAKRYADPFGSIGTLSFVFIMITTTTGIAAAPWLLPRVAATPGVYETRKSLSWATFIFGLAMMTIAAAAIYMRHFFAEIVTAPGQIRIPDWFTALSQSGLAKIQSAGGGISLGNFSVDRDAIFFSLPIAAELPQTASLLLASGAIAAALATASSLAVAVGHVLTEDAFFGLSWLPAPNNRRLIVARVAISGALIAAATIALMAPTDPLNLVLWALSLICASVFPVMLLSVWWKRLNAFGTISGMTTGFGITVLTIIACEAKVTSLDSALAGVIGLPAGLAAAITVSLSTPAPGRHVLELVRDIRVPGGEILYDREMRYLRRKKKAI